MRIMFIVLGLLAILLLMQACDLGNATGSEEARIRGMLYDLSVAFNQKDIFRLMAMIDQDYLHSGLNHFSVRELWLNRMAEYQLLSLSYVNVSIQGDLATASFGIVFESATQTDSFEAPNDLGDFAFFIQKNGEWKIYGNQRY